MSALMEIVATDNLRIALAYATPDNIAGRPLYAPEARAMLRPEAAECLARAVLATRQSDLTLVVYDAYRPAAVQQVFWDVVQDARYVADPSRGSNHTRGLAVDVGLLEADGRVVDMGAGFDDMHERSHHDRTDLPASVQRNRQMLLGIMLHAGFAPIPNEWWHYELPHALDFSLLPSDPSVPLVKDIAGSQAAT